MKTKKLDEIVSSVGSKFRTFGGNKFNPDNPVSRALAERPLQFAAGVDVKEVVEFIAKELNNK